MASFKTKLSQTRTRRKICRSASDSGHKRAQGKQTDKPTRSHAADASLQRADRKHDQPS